MILDLARVLRVPPEQLIGRPWDYAPNGEPGVAGLEEVRGFFTRYDDLLATEPQDLVPTASARPWLDGDHSAGDFQPPDARKPSRPDAVVVCPMTFNTWNKWIEGHADTRPLALLCESLGAGIPIVAVPFVNVALWAHPAWGSNLLKLQEAGVVLIDPATGSAAQHMPLESGSGDDLSQRFDPAWLVSALRS